jgi:hypothetical protein
MNIEEMEATDFDKAIGEGPKFWLGPIVAAHHIGEYSFIEYEATDFTSGPNYGKRDGSHHFGGFINGHNVSRNWHSLDAALVGIVAFKRDGGNSQAGRLFMRATEPDDGECNPEVRERWYKVTAHSTEPAAPTQPLAQPE